MSFLTWHSQYLHYREIRSIDMVRYAEAQYNYHVRGCTGSAQRTVKVRINIGTNVCVFGELSIIRDSIIPKEDYLNCDVVSKSQIKINP